MRVYRVEHKRGGYGPWNNPHKNNNCPILTGFNSLPTMHCWSNNGKGTYRNGCRTLVQITRWFSVEDRRTLHDNGFVLRVFETNKIFSQDDYQLMFWRPKGTRIKATFSLLDVQE